MWIQRHDGSLVNIEMFYKIDSAKTGNGYEVYARCEDGRSILATYAEENQAEEAKMAIFCSMRKGDKAMTMPYCVTDYGEDV